jgi:altronate hydrolase
MQIRDVLRAGKLADSERFQHLIIQETGGTKKTIEAGVEAVRRMLLIINADKREQTPISELTLALQCGASDAYSGITANPALGSAVDLLVRNGGTAILSETTEIYGAEHLLTRRAVSPEVAAALIERIDWWKDYTARTGDVIDNNPSPGNKAGGLTTILEKSLGAQAKGGTTNLMGVYKYAQPIDQRGFVIMDSPGYDPASVTGQVASGANVVCFTTGRGSAFGFKPTPSLKLATNTELFERQNDDMDINCGTIADGTETLVQKGEEILQRVIATASGEQTKSEELGYGDNEFTPWIVGAML